MSIQWRAKLSSVSYFEELLLHPIHLIEKYYLLPLIILANFINCITWCNIIWCSTKCRCLVFLPNILAHAEICKSYMTFVAHQNIIGLQVSIDNSSFMEIQQC